jgi:hypothetical protein
MNGPHLAFGCVWYLQVHKNLTFLTVAAIAIYGVLWLLGSEGTAALGLSQEVLAFSWFAY